MNANEIRTAIVDLLRSTGRPGIERIIGYLGRSDFFSAGCHHHHRFAGGLARHSLEACTWALANRGSLPRGSVILGMLLHDICTAYSPESCGIGGHGRRSVRILGSVCGFRMTNDEYEAIKLHMHRDAPQMRTNALAALVNKADRMSASGRVRPE